MKNKILVLCFSLFFCLLSVIPLVHASEVDDFVDELLFGGLTWLYFLLFLGLGFLISWKIWEFSLIMVVACLFQGLNYMNGITVPVTIDQVYRPIVMFVAMIVFLLRGTLMRNG